jgi:hypothetical protein
LTKEEFYNIVKEYTNIKLIDNYEKDIVFMYINDVIFGWYDDKINAVRIINRFIIFDDNYGHLFVTTPTVPCINMRKAENFSNKLKDLFKQKKQLEIDIKLMELKKDFDND